MRSDSWLRTPTSVVTETVAEAEAEEEEEVEGVKRDFLEIS